jgi:integrase
MAASDLNVAAVVGDHFAGWSPQMLDQLQRMFASNQFLAFVDALARVGNCAHPIRLRGSSTRMDPATGEILSSYASSDEPLGVTYIRYGAARLGSDFERVKTHTYRKTVATLLDGSGASARMIADQLGHSRVSMAQDAYLGRRAINAANVAALETYNPASVTDEQLVEGEE